MKQFIFLLFVCVMLGVKLRAVHMLSRPFTTEVYPQAPLFFTF